MMNKLLAIFLLLSASALPVIAQTGKGPPQSHSTTSKKHAESKTLSIAALHEASRRVSVLLTETEVPGGERHIGSGVWLGEGIVATCWHVIKGAKGPIKVSIGIGNVLTYANSTFEGVFNDFDTTVLASDPDADIVILKTNPNPFKGITPLMKTPTQEIKPKIGVASVNEDIPAAGTLTVFHQATH